MKSIALFVLLSVCTFPDIEAAGPRGRRSAQKPTHREEPAPANSKDPPVGSQKLPSGSTKPERSKRPPNRSRSSLAHKPQITATTSEVARDTQHQLPRDSSKNPTANPSGDNDANLLRKKPSRRPAAQDQQQTTVTPRQNKPSFFQRVCSYTFAVIKRLPQFKLLQHQLLGYILHLVSTALGTPISLSAAHMFITTLFEMNSKPLDDATFDQLVAIFRSTASKEELSQATGMDGELCKNIMGSVCTAYEKLAGADMKVKDMNEALQIIQADIKPVEKSLKAFGATLGDPASMIAKQLGKHRLANDARRFVADFALQWVAVVYQTYSIHGKTLLLEGLAACSFEKLGDSRSLECILEALHGSGHAGVPKDVLSSSVDIIRDYLGMLEHIYGLAEEEQLRKELLQIQTDSLAEKHAEKVETVQRFLVGDIAKDY